MALHTLVIPRHIYLVMLLLLLDIPYCFGGIQYAPFSPLVGETITLTTDNLRPLWDLDELELVYPQESDRYVYLGSSQLRREHPYSYHRRIEFKNPVRVTKIKFCWRFTSNIYNPSIYYSINMDGYSKSENRTYYGAGSYVDYCITHDNLDVKTSYVRIYLRGYHVRAYYNSSCATSGSTWAVQSCSGDLSRIYVYFKALDSNTVTVTAPSAGTYYVSDGDNNIVLYVQNPPVKIQWEPQEPHAQEPVTFAIVRQDSNINIQSFKGWYFQDADILDENDTAATVKFKSFGNHVVKASYTISDGANSREWNASATIYVKPIKLRVKLVDEETGEDFNISAQDNVVISVKKDSTEIIRDICTDTHIIYELNDFPTDISAYVSAGAVSYYRTIHLLNPTYDMTVKIYLVNPLSVPLVQTVFFPSSNVLVTIKRDGRCIHKATPDISGAVAAYLVRDVPYTVGYVCADGEEHLIGTYSPAVATTIQLTTICGSVVAPPSKLYAGIHYDVEYNADTNAIVVRYVDDTAKTEMVCVDVHHNGDVVYHECATGQSVMFSYLVQPEGKETYYVVLTANHKEYGTITLTKWVGIGYNIIIPGLPDWAYPWVSLIPAVFILLGATALKSRLAPILGVGWVALAQYAGWIALPLGGALISFLLFILVVSWRGEA